MIRWSTPPKTSSHSTFPLGGLGDVVFLSRKDPLKPRCVPPLIPHTRVLPRPCLKTTLIALSGTGLVPPFHPSVVHHTSSGWSSSLVREKPLPGAFPIYESVHPPFVQALFCVINGFFHFGIPVFPLRWVSLSSEAVLFVPQPRRRPLVDCIST